MKAIKIVSVGKAELQDVPVPDLRNGCLLVKVRCVALNPIDWMAIDNIAIPGATLGCDFSGTVEKIGSNVTKDWKPGDRVCGWVAGNSGIRKEEGAFAEYCVAQADLCIHIPESMSDEEAASPGAGIATAGIGLFRQLGMTFPGEGEGGKGEPVLIYGGTSATATIAIQLAKLAGYEVITTCSQRSFDHVKSLGASVAFDYKDPNCAKQIHEYTKDNLTKVFDTIAKADSPKICADAVSSRGGKISATLPYFTDIGRKDVEVFQVNSFGIWGTDWTYGENVVVPGNLEDFVFGKKLYAYVEKLFEKGKLEVHPPKMYDGGLESILDGVNEVRQGKTGGFKVVYKL